MFASQKYMFNVLFDNYLFACPDFLTPVTWGKDTTNILCKTLWKRYQCRLFDSITSSQPWKTKNVNISKLQSVKLLNYFYRNEFEGCNISLISQICLKFPKFCTRNITLVYLTVKPIYIILKNHVPVNCKLELKLLSIAT